MAGNPQVQGFYSVSGRDNAWLREWISDRLRTDCGLIARKLGGWMLAGLPVPADAVAELAYVVRVAGADDLADRLKLVLERDVKLLALTLDERALMLAALEDQLRELSELRGVLLADYQWRRRVRKQR